MSKKRNLRARRRPGRGVDVTGKSKGDRLHLRFYRDVHDSDAYQALSCMARCLLIELIRLHNGSNNGRIALSIRDAADLIGCSRNTAPPLFDELLAKGFIKLRERGSYNSKGGWASEYTLTDYHLPPSTPPTREYLQWTGTDFEVPERAPRGGRNWQPKSKPGHFPRASPSLPVGHPCTREGPPLEKHAHGKGHSQPVEGQSMHAGSDTLCNHATENSEAISTTMGDNGEARGSEAQPSPHDVAALAQIAKMIEPDAPGVIERPRIIKKMELPPNDDRGASAGRLVVSSTGRSTMGGKL